MTKLNEALTLRLARTRQCPACATYQTSFEHFEPGLFNFVAEATFGCGARVQVLDDDTYGVAEGCPEALRTSLDEIEEETIDLIEAAE